jgi:hypothetical protein
MKATTEIAFVAIVILLGGSLMWKIGYEIGFDEAMDKTPACLEVME